MANSPLQCLKIYIIPILYMIFKQEKKNRENVPQFILYIIYKNKYI